jgi:protoheme IX farnesyltransferase
MLALTRPRIVLMVLVTTLVGFFLAARGAIDMARLARTLIGTGLAAGGTAALNQYLEIDVDRRMARTRLRPLPDGRLRPFEALRFGVAITALGLLELLLGVNWLSAAVTALSVVSYLFVYTPLKRRSPASTLVGAIPGALPPVTGWAAARGELSLGAGVLFAILCLWQVPHALAIAWLHREDYARADLRLLPVIDGDGQRTGRSIVIYSLALLVVGLVPTAVGLAGRAYLLAALLLGAGFVGCGVGLAQARSPKAARRLLRASLLYLPLLLLLMALDTL